MSKVIVVGSINMDIVARVERHPLIGETVFANKVNYFPGGKGSNQAIACQRLGCETIMLGCVGDDDFGKQIISLQQAEGIDISNVYWNKQQPTGTAYITVSAGSENSIVVNAGANAHWGHSPVEGLRINSDDKVLAQLEVPASVIISAFREAKKMGATTLLNPSPVANFVKKLLAYTDILVLNDIELGNIAGMDVMPCTEEAFCLAEDTICALGCTSVVTTLGGDGVRIISNGKRYKIPARVVVPLDTTGAGDCFTGGLVAGLQAGLDIEQAAGFGNAAASISVTKEGASSSIPYAEQLRSYGRPGWNC